MTRRAAKVDTTHADVRDGLRAAGWTVADTSAMGDNFPDLVVGVGPAALPFPPDPRARGVVCRGDVYLIEVKSPTGRMSKGQQEFAWTWRGNYIVATCAEDAIAAIQSLRRGGKVA